MTTVVGAARRTTAASGAIASRRSGSERGGKTARRSVLAGEVVPEDAPRVLVLVAVDAEVLPVAPVGRVVVVVAVPMVDRQQVEVRAVELPGALGADPAVECEGTLPIALVPGPGGRFGLADQGID